jgi:hydrogenase-4 component E
MDPLLVLLLLTNMAALGVSSVVTLIRIAALQGVILGVGMLVVHPPDWHIALTAAAAIGVKTFVIPALLLRAMRSVKIRHEVEPLVGFIPSLLLGAAGTALAVVFSSRLPLVPEHAGSLVVPASLATALAGFLILTTRRKAITQVVGYLILENGIFVFGMLLLEAMPFMVEIGVLLDLFVGVFVMGIILNHIRREFDSLDTQHLVALKEEVWP